MTHWMYSFTSQTILVMTTLTELIMCSLKVTWISDLHPARDREKSWVERRLFLRLRQVGYCKNEDLHQVLLMNCVVNIIFECEGPSSHASYPIHMHSEPAKYVQASLWCNWYQHIAYIGAAPKVLYPNCCGDHRRLGSLQSCVVLWKPFSTWQQTS